MGSIGSMSLALVKIKNEKQSDEGQGREPPNPVNAARFDPARAKLLFYKIIIVEMFVGNAQPVGRGRIRPAGVFIRAAFRA